MILSRPNSFLPFAQIGTQMSESRYLACRSVLDRIASGLLLLLFCPLLAIIAVAILVRMGRPVLFRQARVGQFGQVFSILKFRTMVVDAERLGGGYMHPDLNLVPALGRFLRKSSLDELPQLLNILKGDMAFVGPRPALPSQYSRYTPAQTERVLVPQGITGLAQIKYRNSAPWSVRILTDIDYARSVGPGLDCRILLATLRKVVLAEGIHLDQMPEAVDDLLPAPERNNP